MPLRFWEPTPFGRRKKEIPFVRLPKGKDSENEDLIDFISEQGKENIIHLDLSCCKHITDISALSECTDLESLSLSNGYYMLDISPVTCLYNLKYLDLTDITGIEDLSPLVNCIDLKYLNLRGLFMTKNFSPIGSIRSLRYLNLVGELSMSSLDWLGGCENLEFLRLRSENINDITPIGYCSKLRFLDLPQISTRDISSLSRCENLEELYIGGPIIDISPLSTCHKLERLDIVGTYVNDITSLIDLENLRVILTNTRDIPKCNIDILRTTRGFSFLHGNLCYGRYCRTGIHVLYKGKIRLVSAGPLGSTYLYDETKNEESKLDNDIINIEEAVRDRYIKVDIPVILYPVIEKLMMEYREGKDEIHKLIRSIQ
jgi:hypothetical protein